MVRGSCLDTKGLCFWSVYERQACGLHLSDVLSAPGFPPVRQAPAWGEVRGGWTAAASARLPGMELCSFLSLCELPHGRP